MKVWLGENVKNQFGEIKFSENIKVLITSSYSQYVVELHLVWRIAIKCGFVKFVKIYSVLSGIAITLTLIV